MALSTGHRLGPYEIVSLVGAGGMGEVYRGRDTRLDRTVAIKVISASAGDSGVALVRFEREARAISQLNHPNICTLYDVGAHDGTAYLVMEYVEGQTLAARLTKGPLAAESVVALATEIAEALATAHRLGIVHRDLKPGNIMLTRSGVKLLDFGLAKLSAPASPLPEAPTHVASLTGRGTLVGTLPYMAPEQLEGREADARTDIFAFGAVIYEMAAGRRAFAGETQATLISEIMASDPPPLSDLRPLTPATLDRIVRKCLHKDPDLRWQTARDLADALRWVPVTGDQGGGERAPAVRVRASSRIAWTIAALSAVVALAFGTLWLRRPAPILAPAVRFQLSLPTPTSTRGAELRSEITTSLAVSPDGRHVALTAVSDGRSRLWLRSLDDPSFRALAGTEGAFSPFWSPDSRFIGFGAEGKLKKVEVSGGAPRVICDAAFEGVPSWNQFGTIVFARDVAAPGGLLAVDADGGDPVEITQVNAAEGEMAHSWPHFLPDGRHLLHSTFTLVREGASARPANRTFVASLDGGERRPIGDRGSRVEYANGYLWFVNDGTLLAQKFDLETVQLVAEPIAVADQVRHFKPTGAASFSVSASGALAYETVVPHSSRLVSFDRNGNELGTLTMPGPVKSLRLSPDGSRLAVDVVEDRTGISDIWIQDIVGGVPRRFTYMPTDEVSPIWWADGRGLVFRSDSAGPPDIHQKALEGAGNESVLYAAPGVQHPLDVSPDHQRLIYFEEDRITRADLWLLPLTSDPKPVPFLRTPFEERDAVFSPDGRWIAFESDESGAPEIYVTPLDAVGSRRRVSFAGGQTPRWRRDGKELFYLGPDGAMMSVTLVLSPSLQLSPPRQLFSLGTRVVNDNYDVWPDGQRFLVNIGAGRDVAPFTVLLNWLAAVVR